MGKGTVTKGTANKNPEHSSSSPQPHQPPAHRIQSAHSDLLSGYGSLIFTDQIARGTKNIENYALKRTTQNKTLPMPSYSSASLSVQYFYHSYAFMLSHTDFFSISKHGDISNLNASFSRPQESTLQVCALGRCSLREI